MVHHVKAQTKGHMKTMKKLLAQMKKAGFTQEQVIDAGDYALEQMSLEELLGEANRDKSDVSSKATGQKQKQGKRNSATTTNRKVPSSSEKGPRSKGDSGKTGKAKAKEKAKKGKGKK